MILYKESMEMNLVIKFMIEDFILLFEQMI
jgi:hypothetical protein